MKISIVSDQHGKILSISQSGDVGEKVSGIAKAGIYPEAGQTTHEVELPPELEKTPLLDLHNKFRIDPAYPGKLVKV
jgi:hypothetical protein